MAENMPRVAVGAIIFKKNKVLLIQRQNPPAQGLWAIPGGKVRWGETLHQALKREIREETGLEIKIERLVKIVEYLPGEKNNTDYHYIILDFLARVTQGEIKAGDDALQIGWFSENEVRHLTLTQSTKELLQDEFGF